MRLLRLQLSAYGVFTGRELDLSGGQHGLHIVYGPNEAGKSTALRALRALFYGFPARTPDAFRHTYKSLAVGAWLRGRDGTELRCVRRKGRGRTLLDAHNKALDTLQLERWLGGVDEALFGRLFGIDHAALAAGGEALLEQRGEEAEALFGAGLGSPQVHSVLARLEEEAEAIFKPNASKPALNAAVAAFKEADKRKSGLMLLASDWEQLQRALEEAERHHAELAGELEQARRRRSVLERVRRSLPALARRKRSLDALRALGEVPALDEDFPAQRENWQERLRKAREHLALNALRQRELEEALRALPEGDALLAEAPLLEALREQLGGYRHALEVLPGEQSRCALLREQARQRLRALGNGLEALELEQLRPLPGRRPRVLELRTALEKHRSAADEARQRLQQDTQRLERARQTLEALPAPTDPSPLEQALGQLRARSGLDQELAEARQALVRHREACERELSALGLWQGGLQALAAAPWPVEQSLRRHQDAFQALERGRARDTEALGETQREHEQTLAELRALELAGDIPSELELQQVRERREVGWQLLRRQCLEGAAPEESVAAYAGAQSLPEAFERQMYRADELADRLRRESRRVHDHASAKARLEQLERHAGALREALARTAGAEATQQQAWQALWAPCGLSPLPPGEMLPWLQRARVLAERAGQAEPMAARVESLSGRLREAHQRLSRALVRCGWSPPVEEIGDPAASPPLQPLAPLLEAAEAHLRQLQQAREQRQAAQLQCDAQQQRVEEQRLEQARLQHQLDACQGQWSELMHELGRRPGSQPADVLSELDGIEAAVQSLDAAALLAVETGERRAFVERFGQSVRELVARVAPGLGQDDPETALSALSARLAEQREHHAHRELLMRQARELEEDIVRQRNAREEAEAALGALCRQAGCSEPEALPAIEQRWREQRQLRAELSEIERELLEGGDGLDIPALEAEAAAVDRDSVQAELEQLELRISQELQPEHDRRLERRIEARRAFDAQEGSDQAAALATECQERLAGIRELGERYLRLSLAARLLREQIDTYRRRHRDPILARAGAYFARLTCGAFAGIETETAEGNSVVLVGRRPDGESLGVEAMSTGTRDQLYLALRLASLEHYFERAEPLPFIVDDILVHFDDTRARATLEVLAGLSDTTQVLLFTHHQRVAEQAAALHAAPGRVFVHELTPELAGAD